MKQENQIWGAIRQRKVQAFRKLYFRLYDNLFHYGLQQLKDRSQTCTCINEVFTELWEKAYSLPPVDNVEGYVFIIFKRKIFHHLKQKRLIIALPDNDMEALMEGDCSYEEMIILMQTEEEAKTKVSRALGKLTSRQIEIIRLRYYHDLSISKIAQKLAISHRTVYNTLQNAIVTLRKELKS